ncbi:MAG: DUF2997 domain-containing protein [bacterium]|nr:DUF2997 domain-containing protein [bacterium]
MSKKIQIKLSPNGEIEMKTLGIKGKKCLDYIEILKKLVDVNVTNTALSQEYYETETVTSTDDKAEIRFDN